MSAAQRGKQFPATGVGGEWAQNPENINLASKNVPKTQTTPVRNMGKVGGGESSVLRMTPAPLTGGGATIYRKLGESEGYPRGHTPEQMREVREVEASGNLRIKGEGFRNHSAKDEAIVRESIARSNIKPKETFTDPLTIHTTSRFIDAKARFNHKYDVVSNNSDKHEITMYEGMSLRGKGTDEALTHEIGHYVDRDNVHKGWSLTNTWDVAEHAGKLEGTADAYARENSVEDPRNVRKNKIGTKAFTSGYPVMAGLSQHASTGSDTQSWAKGYLSAGGKALERGHPRYEDIDSTLRLPSREVSPTFVHPETKRPISGGRIIEYMRGQDS